MAKTGIVFLLSLVALLSGCEKTPTYVDWTSTPIERADYAYEEGLRAGHADGKLGLCDHPFPRKQSYPGYSRLYLNRFEEGYYKGCAVVRQSAQPVKSKTSRPRSSPIRKSPDRCQPGG
jgi:hypothetical protein